VAELVSQRKFAELMGFTPQYVTKLIAKKRIVLTSDKKIDVDQAKRLLNATRDPADQVRKETAAMGVRSPAPSQTSRPQGDGGSSPAPNDAGSAYATSRSVREHYAAKKKSWSSRSSPSNTSGPMRS
jgi:hypothetical protein